MSLPTGHYIISNKIRNRPVGLGIIDPGKPLPVFVVPEISPGHTGPRVFLIEHIADDKYKLKFMHHQRVVGMMSDKDLVWAFGPLTSQPASDEWILTHVPQHGERAYLIETPDKNDGKGWFASEEDHSQVAIRPLISYRTLPPTYPYTEVFDIARLLMESDGSAQA